MDDFCKVVDKVNDTLAKYADHVPILTIKYERPSYTVVNKINKH